MGPLDSKAYSRLFVALAGTREGERTLIAQLSQQQHWTESEGPSVAFFRPG